MERRIFNFGSINIDHVYRVKRTVSAGETIHASRLARFAGGKGANQSRAIARAGSSVFHVGKVGREGRWIVEEMKKEGVDVAGVSVSDQPGGHAIIQVDDNAQNAIVVLSGANKQLEKEWIDRAFSRALPEDAVLIQNEINRIPYIMEKASALSLPVYFNAAPIDSRVMDYPLDKVTVFFINEYEGRFLTGKNREDQIVSEMNRLFPHSETVLTLGERGAIWAGREGIDRIEGRTVEAKDTTGAGDTFIGYFMAAVLQGKGPEEVLTLANLAASISVTREGAANSIPYAREIKDLM